MTKGPIDRVALERLGAIAVAAGAIVMRHFGQCEAEWKDDGSPVTVADREAEALILAALGPLFPTIPVLSEEAASAGHLPPARRTFLLVDALDGTKEFIARSDQFTVNIGMVKAGVPVSGVVYAPALGTLWLGGVEAERLEIAPGAPWASAQNRRAIRCRKADPDNLVVAASLRHFTPETDEFLAKLPAHTRVAAGSSLKFCRLAEGGADIYPRFSPTMEWDTAAGDAVLRAAGGIVVTTDGQPVRYGHRETEYRNGNFIAAGDAEFLSRILRPAQATGVGA